MEASKIKKAEKNAACDKKKKENEKGKAVAESCKKCKKDEKDKKCKKDDNGKKGTKKRPLGCSKCRYLKKGCSACRQRMG